ncbi:hypothetical protein DB346_02285 [Verrucomicrobia bacterium LW23]|nr:hypothetical protein DB346_02285 [Verrucomicrobia bacterium LW23]
MRFHINVIDGDGSFVGFTLAILVIMLVTLVVLATIGLRNWLVRICKADMEGNQRTTIERAEIQRVAVVRLKDSVELTIVTDKRRYCIRYKSGHFEDAGAADSLAGVMAVAREISAAQRIVLLEYVHRPGSYATRPGTYPVYLERVEYGNEVTPKPAHEGAPGIATHKGVVHTS